MMDYFIIRHYRAVCKYFVILKKSTSHLHLLFYTDRGYNKNYVNRTYISPIVFQL